MSLFKIAWRSIQQRALASGLTAFSMALGVMLVVGVLVIYRVVETAFNRGRGGFDIVVGPSKGSSLDLVLNSVYFIGQPLSTVPNSVFRDMEDDRLLPGSVRTAVPICLGDQFKGQRVVGTNATMLNEITYFNDQKYEFAQGRNFEDKDHFDAVLGANAAQRTQLKIDSTFKPSHDLGGKDDEHHKEFHIVGILKPTSTPVDNVIFVNIEGFWRTGGHAEMTEADEKADQAAKKTPSAGHDAPAGKLTSSTNKPAEAKHEVEHEHDDEVIPEAAKRVSAVLICTTHVSRNQELVNEINRRKEAQAAIPTREIANFLQNIIGNIEVVLLAFAVMIVIVAGIGILVSIYNSMNDRRHEIAIMRALGASRATVMLVILLESILLSSGGGILGLLMGHALIGAAGPWIAEKMSLPLAMLGFDWLEFWIIPILTVLAAVVGFLPALSAYRTDVGRSLMANP